MKLTEGNKIKLAALVSEQIKLEKEMLHTLEKMHDALTGQKIYKLKETK